MGGLLDFVKQDQRQVTIGTGNVSQLLLGQQGSRFAMTEIPGRSPNKFGCLMLHLKLAAVYFENFLFVAVQQLGNRFDSFRLAGAGWSKQQEDARWPARRSQA